VKTIVRAAAAILAGVVLLGISGCLFPFNRVAEGPDGELAVVLEEGGSYSPLPEGGAVWLLGDDGKPIRKLLELGEDEHAGGLSWSPGGGELVGVVVKAEGGFPLPKEWRLVRMPLAGEPETLASADYPLLSPTYSQTGSAVLYMASPEDSSELHRLDLATGDDRVLASDLLSYLPRGEELYLIEAGKIVGPGGDTLAEFRCPKEDCQMFMSLWPELFVAISPAGDHLALAVTDEPGLTSPEVDAEVSLYIIDLEESSAERLASPALSPSFSPDGTRLAFTAGTPNGVNLVYIYDLESEETTPLPGSQGAYWTRWGRGGLIVGLEDEEGVDRIRRWDGAGWQDLPAD
jgi:hypothetical protein